MFKVELEFNQTMPSNILDSICTNKMNCIQKLPGKRIYEDDDDMTLSDIGIFMEQLTENKNIKDNLTKAIGNFDGELADLIKDYIRYEG